MASPQAARRLNGLFKGATMSCDMKIDAAGPQAQLGKVRFGSRTLWAIGCLLVLGVAGCGSATPVQRVPLSRSTPLRATLSWYGAQDRHDFTAVEADMTREGKADFGPNPDKFPKNDGGWGSKILDLHCRQLKGDPETGPASATVGCTFVDPQAPEDGNPDRRTFQNVLLDHRKTGWLVFDFGVV
jgi:hypothetical protein